MPRALHFLKVLFEGLKLGVACIRWEIWVTKSIGFIRKFGLSTELIM